MMLRQIFFSCEGTWNITGKMTFGRTSHTASMLLNGKVLVVGGFNGAYLKSAELYDSSTGTYKSSIFEI